jgi:hypothetical protein
MVGFLASIQAIEGIYELFFMIRTILGSMTILIALLAK